MGPHLAGTVPMVTPASPVRDQLVDPDCVEIRKGDFQEDKTKREHTVQH